MHFIKPVALSAKSFISYYLRRCYLFFINTLTVIQNRAVFKSVNYVIFRYNNVIVMLCKRSIFVAVFHRILDFKPGLYFYTGPFFLDFLTWIFHLDLPPCYATFLHILNKHIIIIFVKLTRVVKCMQIIFLM